MPLYPHGSSVAYVNPDGVTKVLPNGSSAIIYFYDGKQIMTQESAEKVMRRLTLPPMEAPP
jgi:hypothetical protein